VILAIEKIELKRSIIKKIMPQLAALFFCVVLFRIDGFRSGIRSSANLVPFGTIESIRQHSDVLVHLKC
jgi:hypothetical protein